MTKQEKIDILWEMMWLNFRYNFLWGTTSHSVIGLCYCFEEVVNFKLRRLKHHIPEIFQHRKIQGGVNGYWWSYEGRFIPWWERHIAIWKTIRQLKKS